MVEWKIKGLYKADPEKVYGEIEALGDSCTADDIVEAAKDEGSELHKCFEWDDTIAARKYRRHQARMLVCQLVMKATTTEDEVVSVRVVSSASERNVYMPTKMLVSAEPEYADLLARAETELRAFRRKYETVIELREIFELIDSL